MALSSTSIFFKSSNQADITSGRCIYSDNYLKYVEFLEYVSSFLVAKYQQSPIILFLMEFYYLWKAIL